MIPIWVISIGFMKSFKWFKFLVIFKLGPKFRVLRLVTTPGHDKVRAKGTERWAP
jgi:hypothetical protein